MKKFIFLIIVSAFIIRIVGIDYGLPMFLVSDEVGITGASLKMLELRTLIPSLYPDEFRLLYYPPFLSYIYLIFIIPVLAVQFLLGGLDLNLLRESIVLDPTLVWLTTRLVTAVLGTLIVFLTYTMGNRMFGKTHGIFASIFVAGSFLAVQLSHFARHWIPATFFTYLIIALAILIYFSKERKNYIWAGALAGIAFGVSYITAVALLVILLAHFLSVAKPDDNKTELFQFPFENKRKMQNVVNKIWSWIKKIFFDPNLWTMLATFVIIGGIFALLNFPEFERRISGEDITIGMGKSFSGALTAVSSDFISFFQYEPILLIGASLGLIILLIKQRRLFFLFISFPLVYWFVLYFFIHFEPRYNLLLVPWFALLAGLSLLQVWELSFGDFLMKAVVVIALILPFTVAVYYDFLLLQPDSRQEAVVWVEENIPEDSSVAVISDTLELVPNREAVENLFMNHPEAVRTKHRILQSLPEDRYPRPAYNVFVFDEVDENEPDWSQFDYVIMDYTEREPESLASYEKLASFNSREENVLDVHGNIFESIINIFNVKKLGPIVEIYKI